jgi:hypothetical protein
MDMEKNNWQTTLSLENWYIVEIKIVLYCEIHSINALKFLFNDSFKRGKSIAKQVT